MSEELQESQNQTFDGANKYKELNRQTIMAHQDRLRESSQQISKADVDAQVEILERLFANKSRNEISALRHMSIQDNELNRQALAKWDELYPEDVESSPSELETVETEPTLTD